MNQRRRSKNKPVKLWKKAGQAINEAGEKLQESGKAEKKE
jgi:hypothetical protein